MKVHSAVRYCRELTGWSQEECTAYISKAIATSSAKMLDNIGMNTCGHPLSAVQGTVTKWCSMCEEEARTESGRRDDEFASWDDDPGYW